MASSLTLPALGASLLLAVAGGIQLGESTVGLINPIHFQGPAIHPRDRGAAIDETQVRGSEPGFASLYGWDQGDRARTQDCDGCDAIAARDTYFEAAEPSVTIYRATVEEWDEPVISDRLEGDEGGAEIEVRDFNAELKDRVTRYAYYEIESGGSGEEVYAADVE